MDDFLGNPSSCQVLNKSASVAQRIQCNDSLRVVARTEGQSMCCDDHVRNVLESENAEGPHVLVYKGEAQALEVLPKSLKTLLYFAQAGRL